MVKRIAPVASNRFEKKQIRSTPGPPSGSCFWRVIFAHSTGLAPGAASPDADGAVPDRARPGPGIHTW